VLEFEEKSDQVFVPPLPIEDKIPQEKSGNVSIEGEAFLISNKNIRISISLMFLYVQSNNTSIMHPSMIACPEKTIIF